MEMAVQSAIVTLRSEGPLTKGVRKVIEIALVLALACTAFVWDWSANGRSATNRQEALKNELGQIGRLSGSKEISLKSSFKTAAGVLDQQNTWSGAPRELARWYSSRLRNLGWTSRSDESRGDAEVVKFCRNEETFTLTVRSRKAGAPEPIDYEVQLGWGGPWKCE